MTDDATTPHDDVLNDTLEETEAAIGQALEGVFDPRAGLEQIKQRLRKTAQLQPQVSDKVGAVAAGLATIAADGTVLDTWFPAPALAEEPGP
ncbi:hypothetical protein ACWDCB_40020, partial [Streptomyces sp. NPDC001178]